VTYKPPPDRTSWWGKDISWEHVEPALPGFQFSQMLGTRRSQYTDNDIPVPARPEQRNQVLWQLRPLVKRNGQTVRNAQVVYGA
jgi:hypothetical protein